MTDAQVPVVVCWGGHIRESERGPKYCDGRKIVLGVHKSITLSELKDKISTCTLFNLAENDMDIKCRWPLDQQTYTIVDIVSNEATSLMLNLSCTTVLYVGKGGLHGIPTTDSVHQVLNREHHAGYAMGQNELDHINNTRPSHPSQTVLNLATPTTFGMPDMNRFATDQIWAIFDGLDGMPRYYARIRNVYAPNFRLRFTWLQHEPAGKAQITWYEEGLPVACGGYRLGPTETTHDRNIFSHLMCSEKGSGRNTYDIYPRKGEVWALFKDWDICWSSDAGNIRKYQYEVVEVLSDHAEATDVDVIHLVRIKGLVDLFMRASDNGAAQIKIPHREILRFSHKVPSYRLKGNERDGFPEGSFQLDHAALPVNYKDTFPSISLDRANQRAAKLVDGHATHVENLVANSTKSKALNEKNSRDSLNMSGDVHFGQVNRVSATEHSQIHSHQAAASKAWKHVEMEPVATGNQLNARDINSREVDGKGTTSPPIIWPPSSSTSYVYPESEFHDFSEESTSDKCQCGQIWALFNDIDNYPNYYVQINKIDSGNFAVHLTLLELCPVLDLEKIWLREGMPIGCGRFRVAHETVQYPSAGFFSHLVQAKQTGRKDQYDIYPRIGEVWAVYKNWHFTWRQPSDLVGCGFDIVEILEQTGSGIRVLLLEKPPGRRSVFIPQSERGSSKLIPADEYLQFSHRIPAFKLTEENHGAFRGFWELDSASVPEDL
ncbi:hypothetical protein J5N97_008966 [Dioscorea zingiberensis]|uniref:DUF3444 domain-containing protein n=1 Tax=Dioscorea zingiberensis TaxID=325984 RepID=A0A9D5CW77_9LILI|nr:hypothetical protein J5N97_008966 [Dioscorea zingiberensis]